MLQVDVRFVGSLETYTRTIAMTTWRRSDNIRDVLEAMILIGLVGQAERNTLCE